MSSTLTVTALMGTGIAMSIFTTAVFGAHMYLACIKQRKFGWEDGWLTAAYVVFIVITGLYLNAGEVIFRLEGLATGLVEPYEPEKMAADGLHIQKTFFVTTSGLWICLWLVKASLLSLYKRLMNNLRLYLIMWWIVVAICVIVRIQKICIKGDADRTDSRRCNHLIHAVVLQHERLVHSRSVRNTPRYSSRIHQSVVFLLGRRLHRSAW